MRKLYNFRKEIRLNGGEWVDTSIYNCIGYCEETECIPHHREITNFTELVEYVNNGKIANAYTEKTFFRKRTVVYLPRKIDLNYPWQTTTEKEFKSLEMSIWVFSAATFTLGVHMDLVQFESKVPTAE